MYNLIADHKFKNNWRVVNCKPEGNGFISTAKLFFLSQKIIIDKKSKLYFRFNFKPLTKMKSVKAGIKCGETLFTIDKLPKVKESRICSIIEEVQGLAEVFIICEGFEKGCKIEILEPLLLNLTDMNLAYKLKDFIDEKPFRKGTSYYNLLPIDSNYGVETPFGSFIEIDTTIEFELPIDLIEDKSYVYKLRVEEINQFGRIYLSYGVIKSRRFDNDLVLVFKHLGKNKPKIIIEKDSNEFNYSLLLKQQILAQIDNIEWDYVKAMEFVGVR